MPLSFRLWPEHLTICSLQHTSINFTFNVLFGVAEAVWLK